MQKTLATKSQRFLAFIIDMIIIYIASIILSDIIFIIINFDTSSLDNIIMRIYDEMYLYLNSLIQGVNYDTTQLTTAFIQYLKIWAINSTIVLISQLIMIILYLGVLPILWDKQTIGRFAMNVKVVSKDFSSISKGKVFKREILGTWLFYFVFRTSGFIATIILILIDKRSLVDYVGGSYLVNTNQVIKVNKFDPNNIIDANESKNNDNDQSENKFTYFTPLNDEQNKEDSNDDDYIIK